MANQAVARVVELEPIDRLEEKIAQLVSLVSRLRAEQARTLDDNVKLTHEVASLRSQLVDTNQDTADLAALREERDAIRTRVGEMLRQLDDLKIETR